MAGRPNKIMKTQEIFVIFGSICILLLIIMGAFASAKQNPENQKQSLIECKTKTTDIDWCYQQFYVNK